MAKLEKIKNILSEKGLDALLVYDELNQRYLTDFAFSDGVVLLTHNHAELITDFRYLEMAQAKADKRFCVSAPENRTEYIQKIFEEDNVKNVGFEGGTLAYASYLRLCQTFADVSFIDAGGIIEELRQIKSHEEFQLLLLFHFLIQ